MLVYQRGKQILYLHGRNAALIMSSTAKIGNLFRLTYILTKWFVEAFKTYTYRISSSMIQVLEQTRQVG
uniref:Uncharacterized protein n=1 Tax=Aegilops tauschii subsp. strangulata TaxID=200361 RepID=A0A453K1V5_AEGTS